MSRVFLAEELALGRTVVVKIIAPELAEGLSAERFAREVKLAARLQQANIVPVLSAGDADGLPYYTMPFVEGLSLRARLGQGAVPFGEAITILRDVARALAYAHLKGVVHRDIKPENILLSGGAAVVTDLGIAKAISASRTHDGTSSPDASGSITQVGSSIGTPAYMAPEQAVGGAVDHRADLYAWGVVAYELLAGAHPFAGKGGAQQLIAAHIAEQPEPLAAKNPALPRGVADLVMQCLEKDPARRPQSAGELLDGIAGSPTPRADGRRLGIAAIAVVALAAGFWLVTHRGAGGDGSSAAPGKSLAVLPFQSVGDDTANTYFAEGIADELTTALSRLPGLRLAGRSAAARFRDRSATEIGSALNVAAVLDGTVRRAGDRIRVSAELANGADGRVLWKETYERQLKDVFAVQDDITRAIVAELQVQLGAGAALGNQQGTSDLAAYDLYLRGLQLYRKRGKDLVQAEEVLQQTIARDPGFARAYATLASVLLVQTYFMDKRMGDVLPRARAAAERAVALSPGLAEAHLALGHVHIEAFEWSDAEAELRQAMTLDPNRAEIPYRLGFMLLTTGRVSEAIIALERAKAVDPFYATSAAYLGWALALAGRGDEGVAEALRAFDLDSSSEATRNILCGTYLAAGRLRDAAAVARRFLPGTTNTRRLGFYGAALGLAGARSEAEAIVRRLDALPRQTWGINGASAYAYLSLGDTARALTAMERAAASDGDLLLSQVVSSDLFDPVRSSPRFVAVLKRFNLDPARIALQQKSPAP
jgi:serine/threonine-protein kinase